MLSIHLSRITPGELRPQIRPKNTAAFSLEAFLGQVDKRLGIGSSSGLDWTISLGCFQVKQPLLLVELL